MKRSALVIILLTACSRGGAPPTAPKPGGASVPDGGATAPALEQERPPGYAWAVRLTSSKVAEATGVVADASGHVFAAGARLRQPLAETRQTLLDVLDRTMQVDGSE